MDLDRRDLTLDLARVFCVLLVVVVHLLFVGVGPDADGGLAISRPLEQQPWFWIATWFGQVMPLFFVVGGFATATSLRGHRSRAADADRGRAEADRAFLHARIQRLARPALPLFVFLAAALGIATAIGVDPGLLDAVATGVGSPLWFLCAYLICQLAAPFLLDRHERAPRATVAVLAGAVVLVDVAQFAIPGAPLDPAGMSVLGYLNLLFVWPLVQQLGFWYADGAFARRRGWQLLLIAVACWTSLVPLTLWGPYSADMLTNLNPPTVPLVVLGLGQAALLQLLKTPLTALMRTRAMRGIVFALGSRLMTIYLWHLPLILALAGLGLVIPGAAPAPG
ncbi:acyltransferase, partial [Schumannella luteola]